MNVMPVSLSRLEKRQASGDCLFDGQNFRAVELSPLDSFTFPVGTAVALTVALQKENGGAV
jgi:hypothetical protein